MGHTPQKNSLLTPSVAVFPNYHTQKTRLPILKWMSIVDTRWDTPTLPASAVDSSRTVSIFFYH